MQARVMFLDCPAPAEAPGEARCGLPAEVQYRYTVRSTGGPLESAKIRCPRGHWFNGPIEFLACGRSGEPPHGAAPSQSATRAGRPPNPA
jgi:hypothetical protein